MVISIELSVSVSTKSNGYFFSMETPAFVISSTQFDGFIEMERDSTLQTYKGGVKWQPYLQL